MRLEVGILRSARGAVVMGAGLAACAPVATASPGSSPPPSASASGESRSSGELAAGRTANLDASLQMPTTAPGTVFYERCENGAVVGADCGLVTDRAAMNDFREALAQKRCGGASEEECALELQHAVDTFLAERYPLADQAAVERACEADEGRCSDARARELLLRASHNRAAHGEDPAPPARQALQSSQNEHAQRDDHGASGVH